MARKRLGEGSAANSITVDVVLIGVAVVGVYYFVVKPVLSGLGSDSASQAVFVAEQGIPASQNPFNYQFQPFIDFYDENPPTAVQTSTSLFNIFFPSSNSIITNPTIQQFFTSLKAYPGNPSPWGYLDSNMLSQLSEQLYSALNALRLFQGTDQTAAMSPLQQLNSQLAVAFVANYFWWNYNTDLLTALQGSLTKHGLTPDNLVLIVNKVNSLPLYVS